ncbi:MAG: DUF1735 domain-containing protein [Leptolyngbyaceae cyanobacterium SM1_3_5]|nr:DUF1735 domain-containing protein [Leptolyngbyaceae cyanobacterium SM1_3_5]
MRALPKPEAKIALFSDRDGAIGTATVGSDGRWTLRANKILRKGSHKITARAIDRAGNLSPISTALDLQILTVDLSIDRTSLAEGGTAILTATLAAVSTQDVTVNLALSGTASSADYTLPTSIVIRAGQLTGTAQISGVEDFFAEGAETLVVDVLSVENAVETERSRSRQR